MQKKQVLHLMSKDGIESVGISRYIKSIRYWFLIPAVCIVGAFVSVTLDANKTGEIFFAFGVITFIVLYLKAVSHGRKFWKQVKDLPEPLNLDEVK